ncbi:MAG: lysozyme inhibitor LprI family protein [Pseudomonadota bacterium]
MNTPIPNRFLAIGVSCALLLCSLVSSAAAQIYDKGAAREAACAREPTEAQEEICLDRDLTRKDGALNEVYAELRKLMTRSDFSNLRIEQRAWLKVRNRCGRNTQCLRYAYTDRLAELEQMAENLSHPNKSHVEIGCDGPNQTYENGRCVILAAIGSNPADGWVWSMSARNERSNRGRYTVRLRYAIPETDAIAFEAICDAGSSGTSASTMVSADTSGQTDGAAVNFIFDVDGRAFRQTGSYYGTNAEFGISGILFDPDFNDPIWEAMASGQELTVRVSGRQPTRLALRGSGKATRDFIGECKAISTATRQYNPPSQANASSCDAFGQLKSKRSDTPVTLTFVNRTGSYRSVMWLNFEGQPVEYANLNPGQQFSVNTYLTHPWMFTDGPGNCIEIFLPNANTTRFEIRRESPAFGPGND